MQYKNIALEVKNWGPVTKGSITIKPLTVLIGPNNTGKSYTAMLYYALARAIRKTLFPLLFLLSELPPFISSPLLEIQVHEIERYINKLRSLTDKDPNKVRKKIIKILNEMFKECYIPKLNEYIAKNAKDNIKEEVERIFSSNISNLVKSGSKEATAKLEMKTEKVKLSCNMHITPTEEEDINLKIDTLKEVTLSKKGMGKISIDLDSIRLIAPTTSRIPRASILRILRVILGEYLEDLKILLRDIYYLPASRAGILHSYRTVAKAMISMAPLAPIRGTEIPGVPGPVADFLSNLIEISPEEKSLKEKSTLVTEELEKSVLEGEMKLIRVPGRLLEPVYKFNKTEIPITRVSSMIAELAPLDLYLKYGIIRNGDIIIIEEPEAHLHPDKQAKLAEILAYLVNKLNLTIIVTTHSDILLAKLSNLVTLNALPDQRIEELGYGRESTISPQNIAVYNFHREDDEVIIKPVEITHEGIPDDVFRRIVEDLYEETMNIYYQVQKLESKEK